jgi:membrane protease YdiL (CAAX protease family)
MVLIAGPALVCGARIFRDNLSFSMLLPNIFQAALSGLMVGLVEEALFRGALFGALRRVHHWTLALGISSVIYAILHFLQKPPNPSEVTWNSGFTTVWTMFEGFANVEVFLPGFLILTLVGGILAFLYQDTGSLYAPIGLHASWVFSVKMYASVTVAQPEASKWFWGSRKLTDGWVGFFVLAIFMAGLMVWRQRRKQQVTA